MTNEDAHDLLTEAVKQLNHALGEVARSNGMVLGNPQYVWIDDEGCMGVELWMSVGGPPIR